MNSEPFNLLFILSTGHSGSTLLDMLLGSADKLWTLGEVHYLQESHLQGLACGCGKLYPDCEFWSSVFTRTDLEAEEIPTNFFQLAQSRRFPQRALWVLSILLGHPYFVRRQWLRSYANANASLLRAIESTLQEDPGFSPQWFVDATKHGHRLFWLLQDPRFKVKLVHLVKDPRAFVYSMVRHGESTSWSQVLRFALFWTYANLLFLRMRANRALQGSILVRYEDLAANPQDVLESIATRLDIDLEGISTENIRSKVNHAVGGNEMRLNLDITQIRLDQKWQTSLAKRHAALVWAVCWPLARLLGYPRAES